MCIFNLSNDNNEDIQFDNLKIQVFENDIAESPNIIFGYDDKINHFRNQIDHINSDDWKKIRWYINDYDFIVKDPIINRAFFKYWEMINEFDIFENYDQNDLILHCAEAPGGFIQASNIFLQLENKSSTKQRNEPIPDEDGFILVQKKKRNTTKKYKIFTISLNKNLPEYRNYNLPSYNKTIIHKQLCITYGKDNTGDINNWENINYIQSISNQPFFLITADGGFDEGNDFNNKEQLHYNLILSEIYNAIKLQKKNGHFILKVFDIFTETSVHLLYLLSLCYAEITMYKPKTSRPTNSEKYIICKNFKIDTLVQERLLRILENLHNTILTKNNKKYIKFSIFEKIPEKFIQNVFLMNKAILKIQCDFLEKALELCDNKEFLKHYDNNLEKCFENRKSIFTLWADKYNLNSYI